MFIGSVSGSSAEPGTGEFVCDGGAGGGDAGGVADGEGGDESSPMRDLNISFHWLCISSICSFIEWSLVVSSATVVVVVVVVVPLGSGVAGRLSPASAPSASRSAVAQPRPSRAAVAVEALERCRSNQRSLS